MAESILGCVILAAAALKIRQLSTGYELSADGLARSRLSLAALSELELLLGSWLISGGFPMLRFAAATICFCFFAIIATYEAVNGAPNCGCFGAVRVPPALSAAFDLLALAAIGLTRQSRDTQSRLPSKMWIGVPIFLLASTALWAAYFLNSFPRDAMLRGDLIVLDPASWPNQRFTLFDEISGSAPLQRGRWRLLFYHYDCPDCLNAIRLYRDLAVAGDSETGTAFIAVPPLSSAGDDPASGATTACILN
jgi:hypothetical protein